VEISSAAGKQGVALHTANLTELSAAIAVPTYSRGRLTPAWVHIGVGNFHRAHQAVYLDDLAQAHGVREWGVVGVGLLAQDRRMAEALLPQQGLYTVVERGAQEQRARVVGILGDYLFAPNAGDEVLQRLAAATTRIVSLTITEGGYNLNEVTGEFEAQNPEIQEDVRHPSAPSSVFGYLCEALDRRRRAGIAPFTVLSCDNLQSNGAVTRKMVVAFAGLRDSSLAAWIDENVAFPNCMVDRITPRTTAEDRDMVARVFGIADAWPVMTEPFRQWIIQDAFCNGRPPLEAAGAQLVTEVEPYEMMKTRLLNASHQALAYLGYLSGYSYVHDVMDDQLFRSYIARMMAEEVTPLLPDVPGIDLGEYQRSLIVRFANPRIRDQVTRLCFDASARMPKFVLPSLHEALAANRPYALLTLAVAGWFRYLYGSDEQGHAITIEDRLADELQAHAKEGRTDPRPLLGMHSLFGDLGQHQAFVALLEELLRLLYAQGARAALEHYVGR
jgi:mannitol-1-phosphate/altronate dehydrogenase